jgi:hypothetical protein
MTLGIHQNGLVSAGADIMCQYVFCHFFYRGVTAAVLQGHYASGQLEMSTTK